MLNIAIDLGSFSVKALCFKHEKKKVKYLNSFETIIDQDQFNIFDEDALTDLQFQIVSEFLSTQSEEFSLILNCPNDLLTSRILELPVNNRKKANLMLPFQLETDLPFSISNAHYSSSLDIGKTNSSALVSIAKKEDFQKVFRKIKEVNLHPKALTSDISSYSSFIKNYGQSLPNSFCILDIGHSSSKAYFFIGNKLVSNHISHIAGRSIDEAISQNYNTSQEEASIYKHQNSFLLLQNQYETVNEDQGKFAKMMDETLVPLISDFKRWSIGFKVKYADQVSEIYLTGGSSNIKNISPYLNEKLGVRTTHLESYTDTDSRKIDEDHKFRNKFANANILAQSSISKPGPINLLTKEYSLHEQANIPLDKLAFIGVRVAALCLLFVISLSVERLFINKDISSLNKKITATLKNPLIEMNKSIKKKARKKPKIVLKRVDKQLKEIKQEVSLIQSAIDTNALKSLKFLVDILTSQKDIELLNFQSLSNGNFTALFKAETQKDIDRLNKIFAELDEGLFTEAQLNNKSYKVNGSDL